MAGVLPANMDMRGGGGGRAVVAGRDGGGGDDASKPDTVVVAVADVPIHARNLRNLSAALSKNQHLREESERARKLGRALAYAACAIGGVIVLAGVSVGATVWIDNARIEASRMSMKQMAERIMDDEAFIMLERDQYDETIPTPSLQTPPPQQRAAVVSESSTVLPLDADLLDAWRISVPLADASSLTPARYSTAGVDLDETPAYVRALSTAHKPSALEVVAAFKADGAAHARENYERLFNPEQPLRPPKLLWG